MPALGTTKNKMLVKHHVMVSVGGGIVTYALTNSLTNAILFCLAGIFIDIDHFFDYIRNCGWRIITFKEFSNIFYAGKELKKLYILLHGYELLIAFGLILRYLRVEWGWAVFLSLGIHLVMDQMYFLTHFKRRSPWFYFLTYRISKGFDSEKIRTKNR